MEYIKMIKALRCASSPYSKDRCKDSCPYKVYEEVDDKYIIPADCEKDGKKYIIICDCDRMAAEAADMIEEMAKRLEETGKEES